MNNLNDQKPSQKGFLIALLAILLVGIPLTITVLQKQQLFKQFAWSTTQTATSSCSTKNGSASIQVSFTNSESTRSMDVTVKDIQSGKTIDLGTVKPKKTVSDEIVTGEKSLDKSSVLFSIKWTDGSSGSDTKSASYNAVDGCTPDIGPICPNDPTRDEGKCTWDLVEGASGYEVKVTNKKSGNLVKTATLPANANELSFVMETGIPYACNVSAVNACSKSSPIDSEDKTCLPSTSPTPTTVPACPVPPQKLGECSWDSLDGASEYILTVKENESGETIKSESVKAPAHKLSFTADPNKSYVCTVTAANSCSKSPSVDSPPMSCIEITPTEKPSPTVTPLPSATPLPSPSATPVPTATLTPTPTPTPLPTATPKPIATATPYVILRTPPNVAPPVVIQQPQTVVQQPQVIQQPQTVVQQPVVVTQQPQPTTSVHATAAPTVKPTGNISNSLILVGASSILLLVGSILFFLL